MDNPDREKGLTYEELYHMAHEFLKQLAARGATYLQVYNASEMIQNQLKQCVILPDGNYESSCSACCTS